MNYFICLTLDTEYVLGSWNMLKYFFFILNFIICLPIPWCLTLKKGLTYLKFKTIPTFSFRTSVRTIQQNSAFFLKLVRLPEKFNIQSPQCKMCENLLTVVLNDWMNKDIHLNSRDDRSLFSHAEFGPLSTPLPATSTEDREQQQQQRPRPSLQASSVRDTWIFTFMLSLFVFC